MLKERIVFCCLSLMICLFVSCKKDSYVVSFEPMENYPQGDTVKLDMQLDNSVFEGIVLPERNKYFVFSAKVNQKRGKRLFYKIYYQNESYKFNENRVESNENFYGSWQETEVGFKPIEGSEIKDSFQIVGNPRNERLYFGTQKPKQITQKYIDETKAIIKRDKTWFANIANKAKENKITLDDQLLFDILWLYSYNNDQKGEINRRERRNPRTGAYKFMLVVADEQALSSIPDYIQDISKTNDKGEFVNPFAYFADCPLEGVSVNVSKRVFQTRAVLDGKRGVYIDRSDYCDSEFKLVSSDSLIGNSDYVYDNALFKQYFHDINRNKTINQIPLIADVAGDGFTLTDYNKAKTQYDSISRLQIHPSNASYPGKGILIAKDRSYIQISNPKCENIENAKKENIGIRARIGFSYGKYRAKIKFPQLVNSTGVWTGLTNAFWLAYQSEADWNKRRVCSEKGYVKHSKNDNETERQETTNYSEIDIEMIKTSVLWPDEKQEGYNPFGNQEFVLACTNWDLACPTPLDFNIGGIKELQYSGKTFKLHRWSDTYRALTSRIGLNPNIFSQDYFYYEIEWKPTEIIWRIGSSPDNMQVVGYMSEKETSIPNNQMNAIITQEFHYSQWWLPEVFEQGLIPFPKNDLVGKIYEITIE